MITLIEKTTKFSSKENAVYLICNAEKLKPYGFSADEIHYIKTQFDKNETKIFAFNRLTKWDFVQFIKKDSKDTSILETCRKAGDSVLSRINGNKISKIGIFDVEDNPVNALAYAEGMALGNYQFIKYKKKKDEKNSFNTLETIYLISKKVAEKSVAEINILTEAVYKSRDMVNEPVASLNAVNLAEQAEKLCKAVGAKVEVMNKLKIETLKMGGLLGVNRGVLTLLLLP